MIDSARSTHKAGPDKSAISMSMTCAVINWTKRSQAVSQYLTQRRSEARMPRASQLRDFTEVGLQVQAAGLDPLDESGERLTADGLVAGNGVL